MTIKRCIPVLLALAIAAPAALGQWVETRNLPLSDSYVAPGELVVAQRIEVMCAEDRAMSANNVTGPNWDSPYQAIGTDGLCATTTEHNAWLRLEFFNFNLPAGATILGIDVGVQGAVEAGEGGEGGVHVQLWSPYYTAWAPYGYYVEFPGGDCGSSYWLNATGGSVGALWGRAWSREAVNAGLIVHLRANVSTDATLHVDDVMLYVLYSINGKLESLTVRNTEFLSDQSVEGAHVEKIEIVRVSDGRVIGSQTNATQLAKLTGVGVPVAITSTYQAFAGSVELEVRIKLKTTVPLLKQLLLGDTRVKVLGYEEAKVSDWAEDYALFQVGPGPDVMFDGSVADGEVFRGQQFLAGRVLIDTAGVPFELTIAQLVLKNVANVVGATKLTGASVEKIEIRRASDDAVLGQATATEIGKLATGTTITTSSYNKVAPYTAELLEIWVTLKAGAPAGGVIKLAANVQCGGVNFDIGDTGSPLFTVEQPRGFEEVTNDTQLYPGMPVPANVFAGQRFLAQRIECADIDANPHDVTVNSVVVQNVADSGTKLAESQIALIEVVRASDGALMGTTSAFSGLNSGGTRITLNNANLVLDDMTVVLELWVTLKDSVPHDRWIKLQTKVWHTEDSAVYGYGHAGDESVEFVTAEADVKGFDTPTVVAITDRQVFQGVRFLAQQLKLRDNDADPYGITITSLMIRNAAGDNLLSDPNVEKIEVRRKSDNALLGEVTDPVGLSLAGVRITTATNNVVQDDGTVELEIWVTLKTTVPAGRKLKLEAVVWHTEGTVGFQTDALMGPATFTTKIGTPPRNVNFTTTPAAPKYKEETSFVPAANITDPEGDVTKATFHWDFGDGTDAKQTTGSATVKHTYDAGGTYDVTLTVTGEQGIPSSKTNTITVEGEPNQPPSIDEMTATPASPAVEATVTFGATVTDPDHAQGPFTYAWDFGDEATSDVAAPTHAYDEAGVYTVTLTVTDPEGATDTETLDVSVGNEPPVVTGIAHTPAAKSTGDEVTFTAQGVTDPDDDDITEYRWNFGDGTTGTTTEWTATHVYGTPNTYTVTVTVVDERGGVSVPAEVSITVAGPTRVVMRAYPNPATTTATVTFFLPVGATSPELWIFDLNRNQLLREALPAGATQFEWDLRDAADRPVANGLYLCMITATSDAGRRITSEVFRLLVAR